jgi:hypothetical protein
MYKKLIILLFVLTINNISAQFWKEKISGNGQIITDIRDVGYYDKIYVTGSFEVKITGNEAGKIKIVSDENLIPVIETYTRSGGLIIKINNDFELRRFHKLYVEVPADYLSKIVLTGSGTIYNETPFDWKNIKLSVTGSGEMDIKTNISHLTATVTGSGEINLTGNAKMLEVNLLGSGTINAKKLPAYEAICKLTGSGDIYVVAKEKLNAKILGNGDIIYYNEPKFIKTKTFGSGEIILRKL